MSYIDSKGGRYVFFLKLNYSFASEAYALSPTQNNAKVKRNMRDNINATMEPSTVR